MGCEPAVMTVVSDGLMLNKKLLAGAAMRNFGPCESMVCSVPALSVARAQAI